MVLGAERLQVPHVVAARPTATQPVDVVDVYGLAVAALPAAALVALDLLADRVTTQLARTQLHPAPVVAVATRRDARPWAAFGCRARRVIGPDPPQCAGQYGLTCTFGHPGAPQRCMSRMGR